MEDGNPKEVIVPEEGEFVIRSGVRSGLKREFEFAVQSRSQLLHLPRTRTRTRSSKMEKKPRISDPRTLTSNGTSKSTRETLVDALPLCPINPLEPTIRNMIGLPDKSNPPSFHLQHSLSMPPYSENHAVPICETSTVNGEHKAMRKSELVPSGEMSCLTRMGIVKNDESRINKTELQMFHNILLGKLPSTPREFLATGLLNGLGVKYGQHKCKSNSLQGVVKDGGILCFCASCNGSTVVTPYQFELHASSTKKHPWDYIYLENGMSIRQVFEACIVAPLKMFKGIVKNAMAMKPKK